MYVKVTFSTLWEKDRKCVPFCLIILQQKKPKNRHEEIHILYSPAYFNWTGVLNKEAQS